MKKLFLLIACTLLYACSSDDSVDTFQSEILINDEIFIPASQDYPAASTFLVAGVNQGFSNARHFNLIRTENLAGNQVVKGLSITMVYPIGQEDISGNYAINGQTGPMNPYIGGIYTNGEERHDFYQGSITIIDLGSSNYKLVFNNVIAGTDGITITGSCEGSFSDITDPDTE